MGHLRCDLIKFLCTSMLRFDPDQCAVGRALGWLLRTETLQTCILRAQVRRDKLTRAESQKFQRLVRLERLLRLARDTGPPRTARRFDPIIILRLQRHGSTPRTPKPPSGSTFWTTLRRYHAPLSSLRADTSQICSPHSKDDDSPIDPPRFGNPVAGTCRVTTCNAYL